LIIRCTGCDTTFTFESEPPKFCQECGGSLQDEPTHVGNVTGEATEVADVTIAPTTAPVEPTRSLRAGERIENYELISILGSGGMGVVWKAVDTNNGRHVALKRLSKNHLADQDSVARFMREAQLASMISHPRVTFVYSTGRLGDQPFITMELMPGETLEDRVKKEGPLPVGEAVDKILDVIDGLDAAHQLGLIHRDVKPSNCFVDTDDRVKIGDFGLSKSVIATDIQLTRTGTFMGTPAYASPEQIRGAELDHRTDIYAVGATLCNLLTGRPPFVGTQ
jgi:serine/threonine protein kinase